MKRILRLALLAVALVALATAGLVAQGGATGNPPGATPQAAAAAQKPADAAQELPDDAKAFNAAMAEKNPLKRVELLEKFIADNPKANASLVSMAKSQVSASLLAALRDARSKYQTVIDTDIESAKKNTDVMPLYMTYNSIASRLAGAGIYSEEAEDFARKGVAGMDERTYTEMRRKQYERATANYEKALAAPKSATPAAPAASGETNYSFTTRGGVMQAAIAPPRPATAPSAPRVPTKPTMPTDEEIKAGLRSERGAAIGTLGQILMKRGKTDEGARNLKEALAANPAAATRANLARALYDALKARSTDSEQLEYLTVLVLSGRPTADEAKAFEAVYRKTHNGSTDGIEAMLDERWRRDNSFFEVTPFTRPAGVKSNGRTVLAEVFPGAG